MAADLCRKAVAEHHDLGGLLTTDARVDNRDAVDPGEHAMQVEAQVRKRTQPDSEIAVAERLDAAKGSRRVKAKRCSIGRPELDVLVIVPQDHVQIMGVPGLDPL